MDLTDYSISAGLQDLAVDRFLLSDPLAAGFPPVDPEHQQPCLKNSTKRSCNASGNFYQFHFNL
jgi:hypothetical protein